MLYGSFFQSVRYLVECSTFRSMKVQTWAKEVLPCNNSPFAIGVPGAVAVVVNAIATGLLDADSRGITNIVNC